MTAGDSGLGRFRGRRTHRAGAVTAPALCVIKKRCSQSKPHFQNRIRLSLLVILRPLANTEAHVLIKTPCLGVLLVDRDLPNPIAPVSYTHLKLAAGTDQRKWRAGTPERHGLLKKKKFAERDQESILSADFLQLYYVPQICKEIIFFPWGDFPSILSRFFSSLVKAERLFCRSSTLPRLTSGPQHIGRWMCAPRTARESSPGILAALF